MVTLEVFVKPRAAVTKILKIEHGVYTIAVRAPPEHNKANITLLKFLRKHFQQRATLVGGHTSHRKKILLEDLHD